MSDKALTFIIYATIIISVTVGGILMYRDKMNPCIITHPSKVVEGWLDHTSVLLSGTVTNYNIKYRGKTKKTHEVCFVVVQVTENQYERLMYHGR